jgi:hypothetical protein
MSEAAPLIESPSQLGVRPGLKSGHDDMQRLFRPNAQRESTSERAATEARIHILSGSPS